MCSNLLSDCSPVGLDRVRTCGEAECRDELLEEERSDVLLLLSESEQRATAERAGSPDRASALLHTTRRGDQWSQSALQFHSQRHCSATPPWPLWLEDCALTTGGEDWGA